MSLSQLVSSVAPSAAPIGWKEMWTIWNADDEHQKLQRTYLKFQELVDSVGGRLLSISGRKDGWQQLFKNLREHGYDADALLEHISVRLSSFCARRSIPSNQQRLLRRMFIYSLKEFLLPRKMKELLLPRKMVEMQQKLDELIAETNKWVTAEANNYSAMSSYSSIRPEDVVGRDKAKDRILTFLSKNDGTTPIPKFSVISIIGMAGIGKTTVARLAYNDASNFDKKIWVTVPVDFDAVKIIKSIIDFITPSSPCNSSDLELLQQTLEKKLEKIKFLIVLDNFWSESYDDWGKLYRPFLSGAQGSKVIVTTRNKKVSKLVWSNEEYILETLSKDDCWEIIKKRAMESVEPSPNLKSIGMMIAKKCGGVPQVANILGNILRCNPTDHGEWQIVSERDIHLQENGILLHLVPNYVYLPTHLQKCFAYCSIFPQGYEFEKEELISLWIAQGYVRPTIPETSQRTARKYFENLHSRFFFYQCRPASHQKQIRYKMHDLIHGMAQLLSKDICFHATHDNSNSYPLFGNSCHLSLLHDGVQPLQLKASVKNERLRTFLVINSSSNAVATVLDPQLFFYLKFLRVLGLGGARIAELVDSIGQLQFLRYLNISDNPISHLPKSVCTIVALEILKLRRCPKLSDLPEEMSSLINLEHLEFDERMFRVMPPHFRNLVKLQYLSACTVGKKNGCGIGELKSLDCLGQRLHIRKIEISQEREAKEAKLNLKIYLNKLELEWTRIGQRITVEVRQQMSEQVRVLKALQPHLNLKELVITNYLGTTFPRWLSDASHNLKSIDLNGVKHCDHLPDLGELPCLTFFSISYMPLLGSIGCEFYGSNKFRSLESFQLRGLSLLKEWKGANEDDNVDIMPRLDHFKLEYCPSLSKLPRKVEERRRRPDSIVTHCPGLQP